jgi:hypothetical protein
MNAILRIAEPPHIAGVNLRKFAGEDEALYGSYRRMRLGGPRFWREGSNEMRNCALV